MACRGRQSQATGAARTPHGSQKRRSLKAIKTAKHGFCSKKYARDIRAFLQRKPEAKTTIFAVIVVYCGFGTCVSTHPKFKSKNRSAGERRILQYYGR